MCSAMYAKPRAWKALTFLLEENTTLGHHNGHITVDVAFPVIVHQGDGDIGVSNALSQRDAKDALWPRFCWGARVSLGQP